eukprot:5535559-Amphidinium_carterae.2
MVSHAAPRPPCLEFPICLISGDKCGRLLGQVCIAVKACVVAVHCVRKFSSNIMKQPPVSQHSASLFGCLHCESFQMVPTRNASNACVGNRSMDHCGALGHQAVA